MMHFCTIPTHRSNSARPDEFVPQCMRMFDQAAIRVDLYAHVIMKLSSFMILPHFIFLPVYLT